MTAQPTFADMTATPMPGRLPESLRDLRILPVPQIDPPVITEIEWTPVPPRDYRPATEQLSLPLERAESKAARATAPVMRSAGPAEENADTTFGRQPTATVSLPDANATAARLAVAALEISNGGRPAGQVAKYCAPAVFESLLRRQSHRVGRNGTRRPVQVRRVRVCHVRDGIAEAVVIAADGHQVRPIALRLEGLDGRWMITALEMG